MPGSGLTIDSVKEELFKTPDLEKETKAQKGGADHPRRQCQA